MLTENGQAAFWCSSSKPDPIPEYACKIKKWAASVGYKPSDLMVVDNCGCDYPYPNGPSDCKTISVDQYFASCD